MKIIKMSLAGLFLAAAICPASEVPPPEHIQWMKDLAAQNGAIRKGADVAGNAAAMEKTIAEVTKFWAGRTSDVAGKANESIAKGAAALKAAGDDRQAQMAGLKMIGSGCKGCHDVHREKISDTENKIK